MLSNLTFSQIRDIFKNIIYPDSGINIKVDNGFIIEHCSFQSVDRFEVEDIILEFCNIINKPISDVQYWIDDDNDLDIDYDVRRIEIRIQYGNRPDNYILIVITYNKDNDCNQLDAIGISSQKLSIWY